MSRILLADDSPHAQRMGERILVEEGFEVATAADGETALLRLAEVDPDIILVDVSLPGKSGYELCQYVKGQPEHWRRRVVLLGSLLDSVDEAEAARAGADGVLQKPLEASALVGMMRSLVEAASAEQVSPAPPLAATGTTGRADEAPAPAIDAEAVRAAVTLAVDAAMPALIDELTERVLTALGHTYTRHGAAGHSGSSGVA